MSTVQEDLLSLLTPAISRAQDLVNADRDFLAAADGVTTRFGFKEHGSDQIVIVVLDKGVAEIRQGKAEGAAFIISAHLPHWQKFFQSPPPRFYQSIWGILRVHGNETGVGILGEVSLFGKCSRLWRLILDRLRDALMPESRVAVLGIPPKEVATDDLVGRYLWMEIPVWGRCKIFYETSGKGEQDLLLLHTAGADGRQHHPIMNNEAMCKRFRMFSFDLPSHGRSSPAERQPSQGYVNGEEQYVGTIGGFIKALKLNRPIVCGASMGGHICLAVAIKAKELNVGGVVPLEGSAHLPFTQPPYELAGDSNEAVLNAERVCGMISPTAPEYYKKLIWWTYSSQGAGIFTGDLKFYFRGWDGRGRIETIDTQFCPVYMMTGEFDYSCTCEESKRTADMIPGAKFRLMEGLGHFPISENPQRFVPYLMEAVDYIQSHRTTEKASTTT